MLQIYIPSSLIISSYREQRENQRKISHRLHICIVQYNLLKITLINLHILMQLLPRII